MTGNPSLNVSTIEMIGWRVAYLTFQTSQEAGNFDRGIGSTFDQVKAWVREHGGAADTVPAIGIASVLDGKLQAYDCCIPISENLAPDGENAPGVKVLPGGEYAIVKIEKESKMIGETIQRFFAEYVPQANLQIDNSRPTYEVYRETIMDFCVPILP